MASSWALLVLISRAGFVLVRPAVVPILR